MDYIEALIALGSNMGARLSFLQSACLAIETQFQTKIHAFSHVYETKPIGSADSLFLNAAILFRCNSSPSQILKTLQSIEYDQGRRRSSESIWGNRCIDIDIIMLRRVSDESILTYESIELKVPHKELENRDFVLAPTSEIAGNWLHPYHQRTLRDLYSVVGDQNLLKKGELLGPL